MPGTRPGMTNERSARYRWALASHRADFKNLAVVAGFPRDTELAAAVELRHHGHHRDDRVASHVGQRGLHPVLSSKPNQIARGRKRRFEAAAPSPRPSLPPSHPNPTARSPT